MHIFCHFRDVTIYLQKICISAVLLTPFRLTPLQGGTPGTQHPSLVWRPCKAVPLGHRPQSRLTPLQGGYPWDTAPHSRLTPLQGGTPGTQTPVSFNALARGVPLGHSTAVSSDALARRYPWDTGYQIWWVPGLHGSENGAIVSSLVFSRCQQVTDRQTDMLPMPTLCSSTAERDKNLALLTIQPYATLDIP